MIKSIIRFVCGVVWLVFSILSFSKVYDMTIGRIPRITTTETPLFVQLTGSEMLYVFILVIFGFLCLTVAESTFNRCEKGSEIKWESLNGR